MSTNPYRGSNYKITKGQWDELNKLFASIEPPAQNELYASGDQSLPALPDFTKIGLSPSRRCNCYLSDGRTHIGKGVG